VVGFNDSTSYLPTAWDWSFGDNTPNSTDQHPVHTYTAPGNYTVTLTASNAYGKSTIQKADYITVTPPPPFLSGWSYRKLHTISGSPSMALADSEVLADPGVLTDYQVQFKVYNTTGTDAGEKLRQIQTVYSRHKN